MAKTDVQYVIDNEEIPKVEQYRYLGRVFDKHLELKNMVEERAVVGRRPWVLGFIGVGQN